MALPNLVFSVASQYDGKGLAKAQKDIKSLSQSVKNFAGTFGVALGAAGIVQFGKSSVKAFSDAQREGVILNNTLKNLGLAFAGPEINRYIDSIGKLYGVTGDQAVPAMQALLSATGSVTKSQEMMNTALNIAAANNISVSEAAKGLSQAYLGNRKALSQYNTGLTKAELQLKSFDDVQELLDKRLKGAATEAAGTYAGQMLILKENAEQAKEVIGKGLIDAFKILAGDKTSEDLADTMARAANNTARFSRELAKVIKTLTAPIDFVSGSLAWFIENTQKYADLLIAGDPSGFFRKPVTGPEARPLIAQQSPGERTMAVKAAQEAEKRAKALRKIEQDRLANLKKIAAEQAKKLALDKASAFLAQSEKVFDLDRIQLAAAAMGKLTAEEKTRVNLKLNILELEAAIAEGNVQNAAKFASLITQDAALLSQLREQMVGLSDVPNPFAEWVETLRTALNELIKLSNYKPDIEVQRTIIRSMLDRAAPDIAALQANNANYKVPLEVQRTTIRSMLDKAAPDIAALQSILSTAPRMAEGGVVTNATMALIGEAGPEAVIPLSKMGSMGGDTYNIYASGIGDQQIAAIVQNAIQELNRYGSSTTYAGAL
jgi:hypothetical protein